MELVSAYLLHLTLASVGAAYCLLGYWLSFGKQWWMLRAGTVCAALAMLVPIRAYEPLVFFALTSLGFVAAAVCQRLFLSWLQKRWKGTGQTNSSDLPPARPHFQFRLHDLLGLMAVIGVAAWIARILLREQVLMPWVGTLISAAVAVAITLATIGLLRGPRRVVAGVSLLFVVGVSVGYFHWLHRLGAPAVRYVIGGNLGEQLLGYQMIGSRYDPALRLLVLSLIFMAFLVVFFGAALAIKPKEAKPLRRIIWQVLGAVPYIAWLLPTSWLYLQLLSYPQAAAISDRPNSLPLLLTHGQALESLSGAQARSVSAEIIRLSKEPGFVQVPWDADLMGRRNYDQNMLVDVQVARSISRGLDAQASAVENANPDLAAQHLLAIIRIGDMLQHEGLMVHGLVGIAVKGVGEEHLARLRPRISSTKAREVIGEFEKLEKSRDREDIARDQLWYSLNDRWAFRLDQVLNAGTDRISESSYYYYGVAFNRCDCMSRLLMIDLALRAHLADHGDYPPKLDSLAPEYLTEVPLDPFSGKPFVYRPTAQDFVLYGVGGDGVDDGGKFGKQSHQVSQWEGYDLDLDTPRW